MASNAALWWIFPFDRRTLNKISIAAAYSLPTSKAIGNYLYTIDLDVGKWYDARKDRPS